MRIKVERNTRTSLSTIGNILVDGQALEPNIVSLEDTDRGLAQTMPLKQIQALKVQDQTCIPSGVYKVIFTFSNHFQKVLPELVNVPGYTSVRIHSGNYPKDTEGCILVGHSAGIDSISDSRNAFEQLMALIKDQADLTIELI
jgi:Family of unknown function (DUF5675)